MKKLPQPLRMIRGAFLGTWTTETLTGDRVYTYPDKNGIVALTSDIPAPGGGSSARTVSTTSSSKSILSTDVNNIIRCTNSGSINITIPSGNSFAVGSIVSIVQVGTGQVTIVAGSGISLLKFGGIGDAVLIGQYARAELIKMASNEWHCAGDVSI